MAVTVLLLRHGQTQGNLERRYVGSTDLPLCPQGIAALGGRRYAADRLFVSPLLRCRETAAILFPGQAQETVPDLRECAFGDFEMRTYEELKDDAAYQTWLSSGGREAPPGGESMPEQRERSVRAFRGLMAACEPGETAALVVHGGTIMCLLEALEASRQFYAWQCAPGGGFRCRWDGEALRVEAALQPRPFGIMPIEIVT